MTVWEQLVGQEHAVAQLQLAAQSAREVVGGDPAAKLAHSWLFTGPPGSGRSVAARAFAAALQCTGEPVGCGHCSGCRSTLAGSNPDVNEISTESVIYTVEQARSWLELGYTQPSLGHWRVILVEDADRLSPRSSNVLLKSLEEPPPRTVWLLCAPRADDLLVTIRSRCRQLRLGTPPADAVADLLESQVGVSREAALEAAHIAHNHIGLAKALVRDPHLRETQVETFMMALRCDSVGQAVVAAGRLSERARKNGKERLGVRQAQEISQLRQSFGIPEGGVVPRPLQAQIRNLEETHKRQNTRALTDELDRVFLDLLGFFRDVVVVHLGSPVPLNNPDLHDEVGRWASALTPADLERRIDAVHLARERLRSNVNPQLNLESLLISLYRPDLAS